MSLFKLKLRDDVSRQEFQDAFNEVALWVEGINEMHESSVRDDVFFVSTATSVDDGLVVSQLKKAPNVVSVKVVPPDPDW